LQDLAKLIETNVQSLTLWAKSQTQAGQIAKAIGNSNAVTPNILCSNCVSPNLIDFSILTAIAIPL
jgi:hypothetical protein